jgi:molybdopterin converting factor small subunit
VKIRVKVHSHLINIFGSSEFSVTVPEGSNLEDLITHLGQMYGKQAEWELQPKESEPFPLIINVENQDYRFIGGMSAPLRDDITVYFIPPAVGG